MAIRKDTHSLLAPKLDDLLNDSRLARLFSDDARHCALQLWILQIKSGDSIENRVIYGRLLPYSHSDGRWSSTDDDSFHRLGKVQAQVIRVNLYVNSVQCKELIRLLSAGRSISAISEELKLGLSERFKARFGAASLVADSLVYRPVAYLLNRDAYDRRSSSSPHSGAGALSASITQTDKGALFRLGEGYDVALTTSVVKHINADTGLDFGGADAARFGDLELMVFPALDDLERNLLNVSWIETPGALVVRFNSMQVPHFSSFQFRLNIENGGDTVYSVLAIAERDEKGEFECKFEVCDQLSARTDSTELELFGFHSDQSREGTLCCRWRAGYLRELHIQSHVMNHDASPVKFDWLEKTTRPSVSARVKEVLTISRDGPEIDSLIGGREADPWVPVNRGLLSLFARLHPPKSEGQFFQRWGKGDGEGRLQFVEWFRTLLAKYQQHQIIIFDPYFEVVGLGLTLLCAAPKADYIVFTALPKASKKDEATAGEPDKTTPSPINNLMAACDHNRHLLKRIKLRIYGLKADRLHDRYILIMGSDRLPVAGFNLSNSFQNAAANYPLLVTPIPADILLKVEQYQARLVQETQAAQPESKTENPSNRLLFDSKASVVAPRRYEPLRFLDRALAGDVLSVWTDERSLKGLSGKRLKERLVVLGLLKDNSLALPETAGLRNCLDRRAGDFEDFTATWQLLGDVLAHSRANDLRFGRLESEYGFLEFLAEFLKASFNRAHDEADKELAVTRTEFFREPVEKLLYSSYHPYHLSHVTKYAGLTWAEYFTVKILWRHAPDSLLAITEAQMGSVPIEAQGPHAARLSLLSQIVSEISLSVQFDISEHQQDRLIHSSNGLLQWMGMNAIERQLEKPGGLLTALQLVATFPYPEQVRALGWMVNHAARKPKAAEIYNGLVSALQSALPTAIAADELRRLVDSMRGHMRHLTWAEPWLFRDVVLPLLRNDRAKTDDACEIWVHELAALLDPASERQQLLFERAREGQTTNIAAFLFAHSSPERRHASLNSVKTILRRQRRIVQQPLASTSDWTRWNGALVVSMWILTFARWSQYYMRGLGMSDQNLEELSRGAGELAMVRPMNEWRTELPGNHRELAAFLDQVEELAK